MSNNTFIYRNPQVDYVTDDELATALSRFSPSQLDLSKIDFYPGNSTGALGVLGIIDTDGKVGLTKVQFDDIDESVYSFTPSSNKLVQYSDSGAIQASKMSVTSLASTSTNPLAVLATGELAIDHNAQDIQSTISVQSGQLHSNKPVVIDNLPSGFVTSNLGFLDAKSSILLLDLNPASYSSTGANNVLAQYDNNSNIAANNIIIKSLITDEEGIRPLGIDQNGNLQLDDHLVSESELADNSVSTVKIQEYAVTTDKLADLSVTTDKLAVNSVDTSNILDNAIITSKITDGIITNQKLANANVEPLANCLVIRDSTGLMKSVNIYLSSMSDASNGILKVDAGNVSHGLIETANIASEAITSEELADNSVGTDELIDACVDSSKLADGSVFNEHLTDDSVGPNNIIASAIFNKHLTDNCIGSSNIAASQVLNTHIAVGAVRTTSIAAAQLINGHMTDACIGASNIGMQQITNSHILDNTIDAGTKLIEGSISADQIASGTITANEIADKTITLAEISPTVYSQTGVSNLLAQYNSSGKLPSQSIGGTLDLDGLRVSGATGINNETTCLGSNLYLQGALRMRAATGTYYAIKSIDPSVTRSYNLVDVGSDANFILSNTGPTNLTSSNSIVRRDGSGQSQFSTLTLTNLNSSGVVHTNSSGLLSTSSIVNADITDGTITDSKLAKISTAGKVANSATTADVDPSDNSLVQRGVGGIINANGYILSNSQNVNNFIYINAAPTGARSYNIPDVGKDCYFITSTGSNQSIGGNVTLTSLSSGIVHTNSSGLLSSSSIVNADITDGTITDTKLATISTAGKVSNSATTATSSNTANSIVARDANNSTNLAALTVSSTSASAGSLLRVIKTDTTNSGGSVISVSGVANDPTNFPTNYDQANFSLSFTLGTGASNSASGQIANATSVYLTAVNKGSSAPIPLILSSNYLGTTSTPLRSGASREHFTIDTCTVRNPIYSLGIKGPWLFQPNATGATDDPLYVIAGDYPTASHTYKFPDVGKDASFIMSTGPSQTIGGSLTLSSLNSTGIVHSNSSGLLSTSSIVNADITDGTITDAKLATISTAGKISNSATTATTSNAGNSIVVRASDGTIPSINISSSPLGNGPFTITTNDTTDISTTTSSNRFYTLTHSNTLRSNQIRFLSNMGPNTSDNYIYVDSFRSDNSGRIPWFFRTRGSFSLNSNPYPYIYTETLNVDGNFGVRGTILMQNGTGTNFIGINMITPKQTQNYYIPDAGPGGLFIMSTGSNQTIGGGLNVNNLSANNLVLPNLLNASLSTDSSGKIIANTSTGTNFSISSLRVGNVTTFGSETTTLGYGLAINGNTTMRSTTGANTLTIIPANPSANRNYTLPDVGSDASFVMSNTGPSSNSSNSSIVARTSFGNIRSTGFVIEGASGPNQYMVITGTPTSTSTYTIPNVPSTSFILGTGSNQVIGGGVTLSSLNSAGVVHTNSSGLLSTSLIVNNDITNGTITDAKLATISTAGKVANSATTATNASTLNTIVSGSSAGSSDFTSIYLYPVGGVASYTRIIPDPAQTQARIYTVPDVGSNANFILSSSSGGQSISGGLNVSGSLTSSGNVIFSGLPLGVLMSGSNGVVSSGKIDDIYLNQIASPNKVANSATTATSSNNTNTIMLRDSNGACACGNLSVTDLLFNGISLKNMYILTIPAATYNALSDKSKDGLILSLGTLSNYGNGSDITLGTGNSINIPSSKNFYIEYTINTAFHYQNGSYQNFMLGLTPSTSQITNIIGESYINYSNAIQSPFNGDNFSANKHTFKGSFVMSGAIFSQWWIMVACAYVDSNSNYSSSFKTLDGFVRFVEI